MEDHQHVIDVEDERPNCSATVLAPAYIDLSSDDEDNKISRPAHLHQKSVLEPYPGYHQLVENESPDYIAAVGPSVVVLSSDDEDHGSRRPVHLTQKVVLEPVGRFLKKNLTV